MVAVQFAVVDQSTNLLRKMEQYVSTGMGTAIAIAQDIIENEKNEKDPKIEEIRGVMLDYARMEQELEHFLKAVEYVKAQAGKNQDMEKMLDEKIAELQKKDKNVSLQKHEKIQEMESNIYDMLHTDDVLKASEMTPMQVDDDMVMMQQDINTKCPYAGTEMKDPVKNKICNHNYDRQGVLQLMKSRKGRARCPVSGCANDKQLTADDLEDNKELKRYIEAKNRQGAKKSKRTGKSSKS